MATAAQAPATPTTTDPIENWLQRRSAVNRANSQHSTGPRTEPGKQRSSLNHEIANTAWRLNRIPFLEAELLSAGLLPNAPSPQTLIPQLATLGLHGSRLSRQFQKALEQLRDIQEERRRLERRQLTEAAELFIRHQRKGLPWQPLDHGFVFSKEQVERHAQQLMRQNPAFYAAHPRFQADPPTRAAVS